jgi:hypothetical protein
MKKSTEKSYQEWMSGLEAKLASKPDKLAAFKAFASDEDATEILLGGVMAEKEFYRRLNDVNEKEKSVQQLEAEAQAKHRALTDDALRLKNWFDEIEPQHQSAIENERRLRERLAATEGELTKLGLEVPTVNSKPGSDNYEVASDHPLWKEVQSMKARQAAMDSNYAAGMAQLGEVIQRGIAEGYKFNTNEVIATAAQRGVDLQMAYEVVTAEQRAQKLAADVAKQIEEARKDGERQALSRLSSPDRLGAQRPRSDQFSPGDGAASLHDERQRVDRALAEFAQLGPEHFTSAF